MMFRKFSLITLAAAAIFLSGCTSPKVGSSPLVKPVLRFAIMGDTQNMAIQDPSSANIPQLTRNVMDMASLSPRPTVCFLTGDLVMNFADDQGQTLTAQLDALQVAYSSMPGADSFKLIPIIGNHESDTYDLIHQYLYPNPSIYPVWLNWITQNHYDTYAGSGPTPAGDPRDFLVITDTLTSIVDPATSKPYVGWIPLHWIEDELIRAQADPSVSHIFVVGHRPVEAPSWITPADASPILNNAAYPLATEFANAMKSCSKVRGYLCSHVHAQDMMQLQGGAGVWQIVSGNAGAALVSGWNPPGGPYEGFMVLNVYAGGGVSATNYWRPVPPVPPSPAVPGPEIFIH
jgi:hypothetical protein